MLSNKHLPLLLAVSQSG